MLEIGLGCDMQYGPGHSLRLWQGYFPQVDLHFLEYDAECAALHARNITGATVHVGDQASEADLRRLVERAGADFDLIIDDGGHSWLQQHTSLDVLLHSGLAPGGLYIIEDLLTSTAEPSYQKYWDHADNFVERLLRMQRVIMLESGRQPGHRQPDGGRQGGWVSAVKWIACAPGICALKKYDQRDLRLRRPFPRSSAPP